MTFTKAEQINYDTADALREAASFLETYGADVPTPYITSGFGGVDLNWYLTIESRFHEGQSQKDTARALIKSIGGKWDKEGTGESMQFKQKIGSLSLLIQGARDAVCTPREVGKVEVFIPGVEARPSRTEYRPQFEWDCDPILSEAIADVPEGSRPQCCANAFEYGPDDVMHGWEHNPECPDYDGAPEELGDQWHDAPDARGEHDPSL